MFARRLRSLQESNTELRDENDQIRAELRVSLVMEYKYEGHFLENVILLLQVDD